MTREETKDLMAVIRAAYPSFYKDVPPETVKAALNIWAAALADMDYTAIQHGFAEHLKKSKWPPTVAELREAAETLLDKQRMFAMSQRNIQKALGARNIKELT